MTRLAAIGALVLLPAPTSPMVAQADCFPAPQSNEARSFAILSTPLAFAAAGPPAPEEGSLSVGVELATLPSVPSATATPSTCRPGKGPENTNPLPGIVRIRAGIHLAGLDGELGWIPPVRARGVRANLLGLAVGRRFALGRLAVSVRAHALLGSLRAPVTCDEDAVRDPPSECFGGEVSEDRWRPGIHGLEASVATVGGAIRPHAGIGYSRLQPRFQVGFTNAVGETDRRRVEVDLDRVALFAGLTGTLGWSLITAEAYYTVHDRAAFRLVLRTLVVP